MRLCADMLVPVETAAAAGLAAGVVGLRAVITRSPRAVNSRGAGAAKAAAAAAGAAVRCVPAFATVTYRV